MDLSFLRRAETRLADRFAVRVDYFLLVAMLAGHQERTAAALAQNEADARTAAAAAPRVSLIDILMGASGWRQASAARMGSFNPAYAGFGLIG